MRGHGKQAAYLLVVLALLVVSVVFFSRFNITTLSPHNPEDSKELNSEIIELVTEEDEEDPEVPSNPVVDAFFEVDDNYVGTHPVEEHDHIIREWRGTLNPSPEDLRERLGSLEPGDKFTLSLPSLGQTELTINKAGTIGAGRAFVKASYGPDNTNSTVIVFVGEAISMAISDLDARREYSLRNGPGGFQYVSEIDLEVTMVCQTCVENLNPSARP